MVKTKITNLTLFFNMRIYYTHIILLYLVLVGCKNNPNQENYNQNIEIDQQILSDSTIVKYYQPFKKNLEESLMNKPISYSFDT